MRIASLVFLIMSSIHVHSIQGGNQMVSVKTCSGKWAAIYSDKRMTIPMTNPFVSNADGSYEFYSPDTCLDVKKWER